MLIIILNDIWHFVKEIENAIDMLRKYEADIKELPHFLRQLLKNQLNIILNFTGDLLIHHYPAVSFPDYW